MRIASIGSVVGMACIALGAGGFCLGMFGGLGHSLVEYTVVNETDTPLLTWGMAGECSDLADDEADYTNEEQVPPRGRLEYSDYGQQVTADCVHVATVDRRLVLVERYEDNAVFTVTEPLMPQSYPLPEIEDSPFEVVSDFVITDAPRYIRIMEASLLVLVLGGLGYGASERWKLGKSGRQEA